MADNDPQLGYCVSLILKQAGVETPIVPALSASRPKAFRYQSIKECHHTVMTNLGLDLQDDSLRDTPSRVAKMYCNEVFTGLDYDNFPKCTTVENKMHYDEVVAVKGISVMSMCEHHFLPFVGTAKIAYIPKDKVLGLSKFNRVTDFFSRRPQVQERLTAQIFLALQAILDTEDVAIVINADHYCVKLRGVQDANSNTTTSKMGGKFFTNPTLRQEFFNL